MNPKFLLIIHMKKFMIILLIPQHFMVYKVETVINANSVVNKQILGYNNKIFIRLWTKITDNQGMMN